MHVLLGDKVTVVARGHGAARQRRRKVGFADLTLVEILPHTRMNGQLGDGIAVVNREQTVKLTRFMHAETGFDRNTLAFCENLVKKPVEVVRMREKSGSLSLGRHRAGRTAQVEIDLRIPEVMQCIHRPDAVRSGPGEQLRNRRHALVVLRQDIALLPRRQLFVRSRCDKRHEILVHT